ncbi:MAG: methionine--tRNA ligase [Endomicrobiia bacterium]
MKKFYLTTPIYYVNDEPHIGHTYTTVIADVIARYYKILNYKTFFLTGTDEHGAKVEEVAKRNNFEPKQYCDLIANKFKETWNLLNIDYSRFIRTTDLQHEETVNIVLKKLYERQLIYKNYYEGLYCIHCEKFISKEELVDGKCPDHNLEPVFHKEENYFFRLNKFKDLIYKKIEKNEILIIPQERKNEILGKLELNIEDISISRKAVKWAIRLPFDEEQTLYVWVDALINYLSGIDYFKLENAHTFEFWPADLHIIGKDILWFHAVIWPALLIALDIDLPKIILSHGFFTVDGKKMSKTLGNVIKPKQLVDLFGVDATRMLIISNFPLGIDGNFSLLDLKERYNRELADNLGNLVARTIGMVKKFFNDNFEVKEVSYETKEKIVSTIKDYKNCFSTLNIHKIPQVVLSLTSYANWYIQFKAPWSLYKENKTQQLSEVLTDLLSCIKTAALLFYPVMPDISKKILDYFVIKDLNFEFTQLVEKFELNVKVKEFKSQEILFKKL